MFLNLLFQALRADTSIPRQQAFIKRALQVCFYHQPPFICGMLHILCEVRCRLSFRSTVT